MSVYMIKGNEASFETLGNIKLKKGCRTQLIKNESEVNNVRKIMEEGLKNILRNGESISF